MAASRAWRHLAIKRISGAALAARQQHRNMAAWRGA
jgi:hypothetical protein